METVKLPGSKGYGVHMVMESANHKANVSVVLEFQFCFNTLRKYGVIDQCKYRKRASKLNL